MYTKEELEIVDYIENKVPSSVVDKDEKISKIKSLVSKKYQHKALLKFCF